MVKKRTTCKLTTVPIELQDLAKQVTGWPVYGSVRQAAYNVADPPVYTAWRNHLSLIRQVVYKARYELPRCYLLF